MCLAAGVARALAYRILSVTSSATALLESTIHVYHLKTENFYVRMPPQVPMLPRQIIPCKSWSQVGCYRPWSLATPMSTSCQELQSPPINTSK
ncbi:uncharacterized protein IWZ02DRAFT_293787 [Phyllosticta citriasiana]|uniref:uncharacterized protein n=1 Tax=Phyllosticta citriasiana TaxID=595635 RepID=UPI0030FD3913